jgi:putative solute:sodium symporter small subunit
VKRRTLYFAALCWIIFGCLIHVAAPTLNGLKWGGLPLGFWLAAQGAPLMLGLIGCWLIPPTGTKTDER